MVRKHLGLTALEWDDLPWWVQRTYLEGLANDEEVPIVLNAPGADGQAASLSGATETLDPFASLDEFAAFGVTVKG